MSSISSKQTLWALVDCNNFYASCERLFRPDLTDKPVVVLSNNDGCIVARSQEAKALGIAMGTPEFKARSLLRQHNVAVFSSNYALYGDISARVMAALEHVCPQVEQYSIDEAFLRLDGALVPNLEGLARALRETVRQWTGITVSVGIATTRTLAKLANRLAKQSAGVCILTGAESDFVGVLRAFPVRDVWGIGWRQAQKLYGVGITSAWDLRQADDIWLRKNLTVTGWKTAMELRGVPCIDEDENPIRLTLVSSRSFGQSVYDLSSLEQAVSTFTVRAAERLRRHRFVAGGVAVHIRTARHNARCFHDVTGQKILFPATADTVAMLRAARSVLASLYKEGPAYAKAGIMLYDLCPANGLQGSLIADPEANVQSHPNALMGTLDRINVKFGRGAVRFGAEGPQHAAWHMRQERRSPRVTTSWEELPVAKC